MQIHPHTSSTPMVLTPLASLATQFHIPIYAVYRIALRLGITPASTTPRHPSRNHTLHGMDALALNHPDAVRLFEAIRLLKEGVHISAVHHLLHAQDEVRLLKQNSPPVHITTLHALVESGKAWMPHPVKASPSAKPKTPPPSAFKKPRAHQAIWAMPTSF